MLDQFELRGTIPDQRSDLVRFVGGTTAVTKVFGPGVAVTYVGTGDYLLTWAENPGAFLGATYGLQATTHADIKGHTVVVGVFNTTAFTLSVKFTNASEALHDLAALEWITLDCRFSISGVIPS
jgi:hypothetical protein